MMIYLCKLFVINEMIINLFCVIVCVRTNQYLCIILLCDILKKLWKFWPGVYAGVELQPMRCPGLGAP